MTNQKKRRPSVSMRQDVFDRMAFAADLIGVSRCAWVAIAIDEKLERDGAPEPPPTYEPERRRGRPRVPRPGPSDRDAGGIFTW